jgi:hypothetical protein
MSTFSMNPTIKPEMVESERLLSEEKFQREYHAQFTDSINGWIVPEILNPCIVRNRHELPRQAGVTYFAAIDPASRGNDFALVILHQTREGSLVMDRVACWTGTKTAPLPFEHVLAEVKEILDSYGLNSVTGDQYYSDAIGQHLLKIGIYYNLFVFSAQTGAKLFSGLKHLMVQRKIELLDNVDLLRQLRNLREEKNSRGNIAVRPSSGNDDIAVALALAVNQAVSQKSLLPLELITLDCGPSPESLGLIPGDCRVEADCRNFPACVDEGYCKGWERESRGVALIQLG